MMFRVPVWAVYVGAVFLGSAWGSAWDLRAAVGQENLPGAVLACDQIMTPFERLACFNDIVRALKSGDAVVTAPAVTGRSSRPRAFDGGGARAARSVPGAARAGLPPGVSPGASNDQFGLKPKVGGDRTSVVADVVRHWENPHGQLVVELDNGQIWSEVFGHAATIPKEGARVEIARGRFGGYRMRINDRVGLVKVKRLK